MEQIKKHIISCLSIVLLCALLFPSAVKLTHAFKNHKHEICDGEKTAHFHEVDIDCDFYKFTLTTFNYDVISYPEFYSFNTSYKAVTTLTAELVLIPNTNPKQLRAPPTFYFS